MEERSTLNAEVAGSNPASPASDFDPQRVLDAVIDYTMAEVQKKMVLHGVDFDLALQMQMAVIMAGGEAQ